jgi:3D (Asp-Asp-Asp) domain-containing protein
MKKFLIMLMMLLGSYSMSHAETYEVTAYTHTGSVMANGEYPHVGAVASNDFPLGTVLNINGSNYVVKDRMAYNGVIDIFVDSYDEAINFGRQYLNVYVVG